MRHLMILCILALLSPGAASAHPGNVEPNGCHYDRKTMTRHCHPDRATLHNKPGPRRGDDAGRTGPDADYGGSRPYGGGSSWMPAPRGGGAQGFYSPPSSGWDDGGRRLRPNQKFIDNIHRRSNIVQTGPTGQPQAGVDPKVTDGDTLQVVIDGRRVTVRLYGIDAPEGRQPGGEQSTAALRRLVSGRRLAVVPYGEDRYGRMVAVVYTNDLGKTTVNQALLDNGHAWYFEQYCTAAKLCAAWRESEQRARAAKRGLWASANPIAPWDWRANERGDRRQFAANKAQPGHAALPVPGDLYTTRNNTYACRSIDDALRIHDTLGRGDLNGAAAEMKRLLDGGKCRYLPDGADVDLLGAAKGHEFFKLVRPRGASDSWWVMQDSLARGK